MYIPIPMLVAAAMIFLLMIGQIIRSSRTRDSLLGGQGRAVPSHAASHHDKALNVPTTTLSPETESRVRSLISKGRKIEAIKLTRNATQLGLKESKDLVEALERLPR